MKHEQHAARARRIVRESGSERRPRSVFPPHDDPAFSADPGEAPPAGRGGETDPPRDTQYAGHPEFSQDATKDEPLVWGDEHSRFPMRPPRGAGRK